MARLSGVTVESSAEVSSEDLIQYLRFNHGQEAPCSALPSRCCAQHLDAYERYARFYIGNAMPLNLPGWRRFWVAKSPSGCVVGHVELRADTSRFSLCRCLFGIGVADDYRHRGMGRLLFNHAQRWATASGCLDWIDAQVATNNWGAIAFFRQIGFERAGETTDLVVGQSSARRMQLEKRVLAS